MSVEVPQVDDSYCRCSSQCEFPRFLADLIFTGIIAFILPFILLEICLWLLYLLIMGLEELVGEVELVVYLVLPLVFLMESLPHLLRSVFLRCRESLITIRVHLLMLGPLSRIGKD